MAGDWIKMRENLATDAAVIRMAEELKTRTEHVVGYCHAFWTWVSQNSTDGVIEGVTLDGVERVLHLPGFLQMLTQVGWLEFIEGVNGCALIVPNFDRHLSHSAKRRALEARKKQAQRDVSRKCPDDNGTKAGPEKRREEKRRTTDTTTNVVVSGAPSETTTNGSEFWFPLKDSKRWNLPSAKLDEYRGCYAFDVELELRKACQWLKDNPHKRKTAGGMKRFLTSWLNRVHDQQQTPKVDF